MTDNEKKRAEKTITIVSRKSAFIPKYILHLSPDNYVKANEMIEDICKLCPDREVLRDGWNKWEKIR